MKLIALGLLAVESQALGCERLASELVIKDQDSTVLLTQCDVNDPFDLEIAIRVNQHKVLKQKYGDEADFYEHDYEITDQVSPLADVLTASIDDGGDGTVTINIQVNNATIAIDGFELDLEVEEGTSIFDTKTKFAVYEYPEITATLIDSNFDEKFNETQNIVQCDFEGGYVPQHSGSIEPRTTARLGDYMELAEVNGTFVLFPGMDLDGEEIHGQTATCKYSFDVADQQYSETEETPDRIYYTYLPTKVHLSVSNLNTRELHGKHWAKKGDYVDFTCQSNGNPSPELTIDVNGDRLASGNGQTESGSELTHSGYQLQGEKTVNCKPDAGSASDSLDIDAHYISNPVVSNANNVNQTTTKTTKFIFTEGDSAEGISCSAESNPQASTSFSRKGGNTVDLGSISELGLQDSGNYTCTATNDLDDTLSVNFELVVEPSVDNDAQTGGASIVIIVIVILLIVLLIGGAVFYILKKKREDSEEDDDDLEGAEYQPGAAVTAETGDAADK